MARVVVAGAGAIGASIAYHLALRGADDVVLADVGEIAGGATGKAMGGVRQQFTTEAEVRLAQASVRLFTSSARRCSNRSATSSSRRPRLGSGARGAARRPGRLGVPVERVDAASSRASARRRARGDDLPRGRDRRPCGRDARARPAGGGTRGRGARADGRAELAAETLVVACGAGSAGVAAARGVELPIRPLVRQLARRRPGRLRAGRAADDDRGERLPLPAGRRRRAPARDGRAEPRWDGPEEVVDELVEDWRERLAYRYPSAAGAPVRRAWAGFYDMTPDAHPIIGQVADRVYAACGFSGHGFMQSPAVGDAVAAELLGDTPPFELAPYRLDRFAGGAIFPETLVL